MTIFAELFSSYPWYKEKGHTVPYLTLSGGNAARDYTNLTLIGSNWIDGIARKADATFTSEDMIKLRDHLIELFPLEEDVVDLFPLDDEGVVEDDFEEWLNSDSDDEEVDDDEEAPAYYLEQDPFTDDWVVYELEYQEIASFKSFDHADAYLEMLEAPEEGDDD
jgi:hypothetical protein